MRQLLALFSCATFFATSATAQVLGPLPQNVLGQIWVNPNHPASPQVRPMLHYDSTYQPPVDMPHIGPFTAHPYTEQKLGPGGEYRTHTGIRVGYDINDHQSVEFRDNGLGWTLRF